jgi:hypothetical protein
MNQFIVIGKADEDTETELCLLTRRVFTSHEAAKAFVAGELNGNRNPQIVECYFRVPDSLYRQDWVRNPGVIPDNNPR